MNGRDEHALLLVVGTSPAASRNLLQRLIKQTANPGGGPAPDPNGSELTLDNKYYTARVRVGLATPEQLASLAAAVEHEAQILVFEAASEASFDAVRAWAHSSGSTEGGEHEPDIKLCVATMTEAPPSDAAADVQHPPWLAASRQWASNNYYEYVEVSSGDTDGDAQRGSDGDLQGVARILEALQAHQWPGLCRKAPPALGWALRAADAQQSHALLSDERGDSHPESRAPHGAPADADAVGDNGFLQGSDVLAFREFLSSDGAAAGASPLDETDEGEQRFDQLMEAFAGSRQRLQQLPDAQRRQAAGSMALQMMEAFGLDDTSASDSSVDEPTDDRAGSQAQSS